MPLRPFEAGSENPLITIVTPCFNSSKYLGECIESIKAQKYQNFEHIIIDGGSTDGTLDVIKKHEGSYNLKWISEPDGGMYDAINKGFALSKGEILCWLNSDDMYLPWTLEVVCKSFKYYKINWLSGIPAHWTQNSTLYTKQLEPPAYSCRAIKTGLHHGRGLGFIQQESTFWSKHLWDAAGGKLRTDKKLSSDFYLWREFAAFSTLYTIDILLGGFRRHPSQQTADMDHYYDEIKKYCTLPAFILWVLNKALNSNKLYFWLNRSNRISGKVIINYPSERYSNSPLDVLRWFYRFVLKRA